MFWLRMTLVQMLPVIVDHNWTCPPANPSGRATYEWNKLRTFSPQCFAIISALPIKSTNGSGPTSLMVISQGWQNSVLTRGQTCPPNVRVA